MLQILPVLFIFILSVLFFNNSSSNSKLGKNVSVVIPAFNEEQSIRHVIETVKQVKSITEIIVVDDGSSDKTFDIVSKIDGVILLQHSKNKGKGAAMKTGLTKVHNDIVLFLDADLSEINKYQVESIIKPILDGEADITKTKFKREAGRVTELTAKPLLQFFFPELNFDQPLSGQFASIKSFLDGIDLEHDYGVDIGIVLDADAQGMRIQEVDIGNIVHEMSTLQELNIMANEVVRTIVDRAIGYGRLTMMDDLGNAIRMEIMGLSLVTFGIFGVFFIKFLTPVLSVLIVILGLIISLYYMLGIIKMSVRVYKQSKVPTLQIIKSFIHMHFPVIVSIIFLLAIVFSLLGSVNISSNEISIEPASKNLVISTSPEPRSSVDIRGPYTIESALENEQQLIRLPNSALNTLQAQYGDTIYIGGQQYQLEQVVNEDYNIIRVPEYARGVLDVKPQDVVRDSDLKNLFAKSDIVRNLKGDEKDIDEGNVSNESRLSVLNASNISVGSEISTQSLPAKTLMVYVNDTNVGQISGVVNEGTYGIYINNVSNSFVSLNNGSSGVIYNATYSSSSVRVVLEDSDVNSTNVFATSNSTVRFLNINIL